MYTVCKYFDCRWCYHPDESKTNSTRGECTASQNCPYLMGCTISYWEFMKDTEDKRVQHICMNEEEALAVADAIYKLFKKN